MIDIRAVDRLRHGKGVPPTMARGTDCFVATPTLTLASGSGGAASVHVSRASPKLWSPSSAQPGCARCWKSRVTTSATRLCRQRSSTCRIGPR
jgi:hypothetical protein